MASHSAQASRLETPMAVHLLVGAFALGMLAVGLAWLPGPRANLALIAGAVTAASLVVGVWSRSWLIEIYAPLLAMAICVVGAGVYYDDETLAGVGVVSVILVGASAPLAVLLSRRSLAIAPASNASSMAEGVDQRLARLEQHLVRLHETSMLSDNARRVLFRDRELGLLRRAIEDDIARGDFNAGLTLCQAMADLFGFREEAEKYRSRILEAREGRYVRQLEQEFEQLDAMLRAREWARAHQEAARIRRLYPEPTVSQEVDDRIDRARREHTLQLEAQFVETANRGDVADAMQLLRQLDRFLTKDEAERIAPVAQNVVTRHRENLSVQFKLAVNEKRWLEAIRIGDEIAREFPNTKMAEEFRSIHDLLQQRAQEAAMPPAVAQPA